MEQEQDGLTGVRDRIVGIMSDGGWHSIPEIMTSLGVGRSTVRWHLGNLYTDGMLEKRAMMRIRVAYEYRIAR